MWQEEITTVMLRAPRNGIIQVLRRVKTEARGALGCGDSAPTGDLLTNVFEKAMDDRGASIGAEAPALGIACRCGQWPVLLYGVVSATTKFDFLRNGNANFGDSTTFCLRLEF